MSLQDWRWETFGLWWFCYHRWHSLSLFSYVCLQWQADLSGRDRMMTRQDWNGSQMRLMSCDFLMNSGTFFFLLQSFDCSCVTVVELVDMCSATVLVFILSWEKCFICILFESKQMSAIVIGPADRSQVYLSLCQHWSLFLHWRKARSVNVRKKSFFQLVWHESIKILNCITSFLMFKVS